MHRHGSKDPHRGHRKLNKLVNCINCLSMWIKILFKKTVRSSKKYMTHDEGNKFKIGDLVQIRECKPLSKSKTWEVIDD